MDLSQRDRAFIASCIIHGCVVQGLTSAGHYGPVAVGKPDERIVKEVGILVEKFAALVAKL